MSDANDRQEGGAHYKDAAPVQPWDIIAMYGLDFFEGNVIKYVLRRKGSRVEDLKKARHYIDKKIELLERGITPAQEAVMARQRDISDEP